MLGAEFNCLPYIEVKLCWWGFDN